MRTGTFIDLWLTDPGAAGDASASVSGGLQTWSEPADLPRDWLDGHIPAAATLEEGFGWPLDGSRDLLPDDPTAVDWGAWGSALEDGETARTAELSLSAAHSSTGITLEFPGALPETVLVRWYDGEDALLAEETVRPAESLCFCQRLVEGYRRVTLELSGVPAGRWFRLQSVLFGNLERLDGSRITRAVLTEETDPTMTTLPVSTLEVSFHTGDGRFRILSPDTAYRAFRRRQRADVWQEIDGVRERVFVLYLAELSGVSEAVTSLTFEDILGVLDRQTCDGGIWQDSPVEDILDGMGLRYELDPNLTGETLSGHLPVQTVRESLRDLCFALGARAETRQGFVRLVPEEGTAARVIGPDRRIVGHELTQEDPITRVEVTAHTWALRRREGEDEEDEARELPTLASGSFPAGRHRIEFSAPGVWKEIRADAELLESHVNYVVLELAKAQDVEIVGWEYTDTSSMAAAETETAGNETDRQTESVQAGALTDPVRGQTAAERLLAYYRRRYTDKGDLLPGWERAGDRVTVETPWGGQLHGWIERLTVDLYAGGIQTAEIRGERMEE